MYARTMLTTGLASVVAACSTESIRLGSECPEPLERCVDDGSANITDTGAARDDRPGPADAHSSATGTKGEPSLDGSTRSHALLDADQQLDARRGPEPQPGEEAGANDASSVGAESTDAGGSDAAAGQSSPPSFPMLENASFAITGGTVGPLAYEPLDPLAIGTNLAAPWAACRPGFSVVEQADSVDGSRAGDVLPREGTTFVEANLSVIDFVDLMGLRQALATPLRAGERYALRVDVRASSGADVTLELWGSYFDCVPSPKLADVGAIGDGAWTDACLSFVAPAAIPELILAPSRRSPEIAPARVFFDNIRAGSDCD